MKMKTYRNKKFGFEMDVPEEWPHPTTIDPDTLVFNCAPIEVFNFVIGFLLPERLLEYTEFEFRAYAQINGYADLDFGRISVGDKDHVWACYKMGSAGWAKKYMVVFARVEYAITASCYDQQTFAEREPIWDAVVKSFRLNKWAQRDVDFIKSRRREVAGELYARAYEAVTKGLYPKACTLLEQCLSSNPDHILAHKELALVLKNMGDVRGALPHRQKVKRLDPSDKVNRFNLAGLYVILGNKEDALKEIEELLVVDPQNQRFLELRRAIMGSPLTYPQHYDEESQQQLGKKCTLKLIDSIIPDHRFILLLLVYHWEEHLPDEEARRLALRAIAFVCCAIYDVAISAGLSCQPSPTPNGRRPAWILEGEKAPVSLILSDFDLSERICPMTIGTTVIFRRESPIDRIRWENLHRAFKARFSEISV